MIFHENHLPADESHEISYLTFFWKMGKMSQNWLSAAVMIGALKVKWFTVDYRDPQNHSEWRLVYSSL